MTVVGDSTTGLAEVAPLSGRDDDEVVGYVRSPSDVLRLVTYATATVVLLVVTRFAEDSVAGFELDVLDLVTFLPTAAERILAGVASVLVLVITIGVFVPPIVLKRYRLLGYEVLANAVAVALVGLAAAWLDRGAAPEIANRVADRAGVDVGEVLSARTMAQIVSSFVILAPFVSHRWRTTGVGLVVVLALMRLLLSADVPSELVLSLAIGAMVGSGTLLAFGRPDRRPTLAAVTPSLTRSRLAPAPLERASSGPVKARERAAARSWRRALRAETGCSRRHCSHAWITVRGSATSRVVMPRIAVSSSSSLTLPASRRSTRK